MSPSLLLQVWPLFCLNLYLASLLTLERCNAVKLEYRLHTDAVLRKLLGLIRLLCRVTLVQSSNCSFHALTTKSNYNILLIIHNTLWTPHQIKCYQVCFREKLMSSGKIDLSRTLISFITIPDLIYFTTLLYATQHNLGSLNDWMFSLLLFGQ